MGIFVLTFFLGIAIVLAPYYLKIDILSNILFDSRLHYTPVQLKQLQFVKEQLFSLGLFLIITSIIALIWGKKFISLLKEGVESKAKIHHPYLFLFWVSFISLYFEIIFIRWISTEVRVLAFFKNVPLIAAFLGLSLGCMLSQNQKRLELVFPFLFSLLIIFIGFGSDTYIRVVSFAGATISTADLHIWGHLLKGSLYLLSALIFYGGITFLFVFQVAVMIPLGHLVGRGFMGLDRIKAYSVNILGSLIGIYFYYFLTKLNTSPLIWFSVGSIAVLFLILDRKWELIFSIFSISIALLVISRPIFPRIWSPYNRLTVTDSYLWKNKEGKGSVIPEREGEWIKIGKRIDVCDLFYMDITDFSDNFINKHPYLYDDIKTYGYNLPYVVLKPKKVLIVGSGGGNDIAAALRHGVEKIDAVEIDPIIAGIGKKLHPEQPYSSNKVNLFIDDARHFFNTTKGKYDLVVFGLLDSHSLFSTHSSVRLDNYVYTVDAFMRVKELLTPNGSVVVTFAIGKKWMYDRFELIFKEVFGKRPIILQSRRGTSFISGLQNNYAHLIENSPLKKYIIKRKMKIVPLSTDDWPFMYQADRMLPSSYLWALIIMAIASIIWILKVIPKSDIKWEGHFFWLGAAFLLIEIKSISQLALILGSTWTVNAIVIGTIMFLILAANFISYYFKIRKLTLIYIFLLLSVLISYLLPLKIFLSYGLFIGKLLPTFILLIPLFFAGIIFANSFKNCRNAQIALGWNLLGSVLGGLLEYTSVIFGFKKLALFAMALYIMSWIWGNGDGNERILQSRCDCFSNKVALQ